MSHVSHHDGRGTWYVESLGTDNAPTWTRDAAKALEIPHDKARDIFFRPRAEMWGPSVSWGPYKCHAPWVKDQDRDGWFEMWTTDASLLPPPDPPAKSGVSCGDGGGHG